MRLAWKIEVSTVILLAKNRCQHFKYAENTFPDIAITSRNHEKNVWTKFRVIQAPHGGTKNQKILIFGCYISTPELSMSAFESLNDFEISMFQVPIVIFSPKTTIPMERLCLQTVYAR